MSGFSVDWLALREPADHAARNGEMVARVAGWFGRRDTISIVDLASGTGSTVRAIADQLPSRQLWTLTDNDAALLQHAEATSAGRPGLTIKTRRVDLNEPLDALFVPAPDLVTTSAFLDLVSTDWIERLAAALVAANLPFYGALSYDGRMDFDPCLALDERVRELVNTHQHGDKGFGAALGPDAVAVFQNTMEQRGWIVHVARSDWVLKPEDAGLVTPLLAGWASAASEIAPHEVGAIDGWRTTRQAAIKKPSGRVTVGHLDCFAVPPVAAG
ncbi:MAG: class I SAM-dependent methyltransferase [Pseudomonadota bacterium]